MLVAPEARAAQRCLRRIESAFPANPPAEDLTVLAKRRWFDEGGKAHGYEDPADSEIADFFGQAAWTAIEAEALLRWLPAGTSLGLMSLEAVKHYLPAYLRALLTVPLDPIAFAVLEYVVRKLTPASKLGPLPDTVTDAQRSALSASRDDAFAELAAMFDSPQRAAIAEFLRTVEPLFEDDYEDNDATVALDSFWGAYEQPA